MTVYVIFQCDASKPEGKGGHMSGICATQDAADRTVDLVGKQPGIRFEIRPTEVWE